MWRSLPHMESSLNVIMEANQNIVEMAVRPTSQVGVPRILDASHNLNGPVSPSMLSMAYNYSVRKAVSTL